VTATAPSTSPIATAPAIVAIGQDLAAVQRQLAAQRKRLGELQAAHAAA